MNTSDYFEVNLRQGANTVVCAAVNKNGKRGSEKVIKFYYANPGKNK
jgi:hypothetical protein